MPATDGQPWGGGEARPQPRPFSQELEPQQAYVNPHFSEYRISMKNLMHLIQAACDCLPLINRQRSFVELQDGQGGGGGVDGSDVAPAARAGPAAVVALTSDQIIEHPFAVFSPG